MRITTARRISQVFFLLLLFWFCAVATLGERWWELRGWPVNWLLELDPLAALGTLLTTGTVYRGMLWSLVTVVLTILLGRFFCGWVCPFGTLHQFVGYLARRRRPVAARIAGNDFSRWQVVKYWLLVFLLGAAALEATGNLVALPRSLPVAFAGIAAVLLAVGALWARGRKASIGSGLAPAVSALAVWGLLGLLSAGTGSPAASLQVGLLDPLPLMHRSVNLILIPLAAAWAPAAGGAVRFYQQAGATAAVFFTALLLNLKVPRFYCRFVCPLGALFGLLSRWAPWRIGKSLSPCSDCRLCERDCEGACRPGRTVRTAECLLCMNCLDACPDDLVGYRTTASEGGEVPVPDLSRRALLVNLAAGAAALPLLRIDGRAAAGWNPEVVRPPGALHEAAFLSRCIKCGQCMRVCPTNVIQPGGLQAGIEGLWTPMLDFRLGTSGCQYGCIACGHVCPTAALRPLSLDERLGRQAFADRGAVKIGTAFLDRGRCLPWAMKTPCIVCQENCPLSPKAILTEEHFSPVPGFERVAVSAAGPTRVEVSAVLPADGRFAGGDHYGRLNGGGDPGPRAIVTQTGGSFSVAAHSPWQPAPAPGNTVQILVRLQRPYVVPERCIGCGVCQHECPVRGRRAIRVTAENESRDRRRRMTLL